MKEVDGRRHGLRKVWYDNRLVPLVLGGILTLNLVFFYEKIPLIIDHLIIIIAVIHFS